MPVTPSINNFNAGEMSPYLIGRTDLDKYGSGCQRMENFRALPYGGAVRRPGTEFINTVIGPHRLKEFIYSTETSYVLAFGFENIKIFRNGAYLGVPADVATPYSSDDVFALQFLQINDVMYITHPDYPVHKLSRVSSTVFTLAEVVFDLPPFLDVNTESSYTLQADGTSGTVEITAAGFTPFTAEHVGSYWQISHFREASSVSKLIDGDGASSSISLRGLWNLKTYGEWDATVLVERSPDNATWEVIASFPSGNQIEYEATQEDSAYLRIRVADYVSNTDGNAVLTTSTNYVDGLVKMTAFTDSTHMDAEVITGLASTDATTRWNEGSWSEYRGFPKCVAFFQDRLYFANSYYEPQRVWGSTVGQYEDFFLTANDDAAISFVIADVQQNPIQWIFGERSLLLSTTAAQWTVGGGESGSPITPSNIPALRQPSNLGGEPFQPVSLPGITLLLQRGGRKFRELFFQFVESAYSAQDVTLLAEHITESGIKQFAATNHPDSIAYCVRNDGQLAVMVYERGQSNGGAGNLVAWSRYVTDGEFESVTVIPGDIEDEVWCVVARRDVAGVIVRCVERFRNRLEFLGDRSDWYFLDCGRTVDVFAQKAITSIERLAYGSTFSVDGVTSQRVIYRVNSTAHGLTNAQNVRITGSAFDELNGEVFKVCTANVNVFYLGLLADDHPISSVTAITQANPGIVTTAAPHEVESLTPVFMRSVGGMTNVNGNYYSAAYVTPTTFSLGVNTTAYGAYTTGGSVDLLFNSVQQVGYAATAANGTATVVTNVFNTASVLGVREQSLVIDGSPADDVTADTFDTPTLTGSGRSETYGSVLHAGLPYTSYLLPNPLEIALQTGSSTSVKKRVAKIDVRFKNSVGAKVGPDEDNLEEIPFRSTSQNMDEPVAAFTGIKSVEPKMDIVLQADILIVQYEPLNCEVLAISPKAEFYP